ncbi:MAG TPA: hypothetical protein VII92_18445 [Anaerolineae bacterium]
MTPCLDEPTLTIAYGWLDVEPAATQRQDVRTGRLRQVLHWLRRSTLDSALVLRVRRDGFDGLLLANCNRWRYDHVEITLSGDWRDILMDRMYTLPLPFVAVLRLIGAEVYAPIDAEARQPLSSQSHDS